MKKLSTIKRWKRLLRLAALSVLVFSGRCELYAQFPASSYGFTAVGGTYTDITGGTNVAILGDDVQSATINLGFTFNYCGLNYTAIKANSNSWITFGNGTTDAVAMRENNTTNLNTLKPLLMPLWDDNNGNAGTSMYLVTGAAPNRVFTLQWKSWKWNWTSAVNISYQVKLYETTNVIEFIYFQEPNAGTPANSGGCTIGIGDAAATPTYLSLNNATATPTASSTVFTTNITTRPATGQIYRFTPPPPCTTVTTWPAVSAATAAPNPVCINPGIVNLNITATMPAVTGLTYQWEWSLNGTTGWTDIGPALTAPGYAATGITTTRYFRCKVFCNGGTVPVWVSGNTPQVVVSDPGSPTVTPGARCGPGTVALGATTTAPGGSIRWYLNTTATIPLATGNTYNTPYLTQTTTYYAAAVTNATLQTFSVGLPNFIQNNPFFTITPGWGLRFTVTNTCNIDSVGVYPIGTGTVSMAIYNATTQALVYTSPVSPVITGTGIEKRMIAVGALNLAPGNYVMSLGAVTGLTNLRNEGFNPSAYPFTCPALSITAGSQGFAGTGTPNVYYFSYDWKVSMIGGCEGPRLPVTATINPSPVVTKTAPPVVCNNSVATITLTPPTPPYPNYTWTPITNLYTDAAATVPYVAGGSATTVYMKTTNVGTQTYYMMAGNPNVTTGCTFADTIKVWSQPGNVTIKGQPDTICVSGTTTLSLDTISGYYPGSIQWQDSIPGTSPSFTNIAGATNPTYVTPSLAFGQNRYYRAIIKAGTSTCQSPVKYVVIANPTIISAPDSFNCGPGTVTLTAVTGGNGSAVWYQNPTGGFPLGTGSTFVTPYLGATTSYYVSSGAGGSSGVQTIGAGALVSATQSVTPFSSGWGASKHQYLIRAAELAAAGIPAGATLKSLALDVVAGGVTYPGFAISLKNTTTTALPAAYEAGTFEVKTPSNVTTAAGINTYIFDSPVPFAWDGTSNLLIQTCWSNGPGVFNATGSTVRYDNTTYVATRRGQTDNITPANMCAATTSSTSLNYSQRPKFLIGYDNRCESARQEVIAYIHPVPAVDLGPDINKCVDAGAIEVLDAGVQPNSPQFLWDNGSTSQVRAVNASGTYMVTVTNQYTCANSDTINVVLRKNPIVNLGNDTTVCNGVVLTLNAGNDGISYFWNTGQTSQTITVNSPGVYNVFVTNNLACVKADTITVNMAGELPTISGINFSNNGVNTFYFTAVNPQNVIGYDWDFGDGTPHSYQAAPTHTYANVGNYVVVLKLSSSCGFFDDTTSAHIVGINPVTLSNDELMVYPNPSRETATILNKSGLKMEKIELYNVLGQVVYRSEADSREKHILKLSALASGIYTIEIYTDKGTVARKLEILK